jgi:hypothetical protein
VSIRLVELPLYLSRLSNGALCGTPAYRLASRIETRRSWTRYWIMCVMMTAALAMWPAPVSPAATRPPKSRIWLRCSLTLYGFMGGGGNEYYSELSDGDLSETLLQDVMSKMKSEGYDSVTRSLTNLELIYVFQAATSTVWLYDVSDKVSRVQDAAYVTPGRIYPMGRSGPYIDRESLEFGGSYRSSFNGYLTFYRGKCDKIRPIVSPKTEI